MSDKLKNRSCPNKSPKELSDGTQEVISSRNRLRSSAERATPNDLNAYYRSMSDLSSCMHNLEDCFYSAGVLTYHFYKTDSFEEAIPIFPPKLRDEFAESIKLYREAKANYLEIAEKINGENPNRGCMDFRNIYSVEVQSAEFLQRILIPGTEFIDESGATCLVASHLTDFEEIIIVDEAGKHHKLPVSDIGYLVKEGKLPDSAGMRDYDDVMGSIDTNIHLMGNKKMDAESFAKSVAPHPILRNQYHLLANLASEVQDYLADKPEATYFELKREFLTDDLGDQLSPSQAGCIIDGFKNINRISRAIKEYYSEFLQDPKAALETLFELEHGTIKGDVDIYNTSSTIHFHCKESGDYSSIVEVYNPAMKNSGGFAAGPVSIPVLYSAITVSCDSSIPLQEKIEHEKRHQINKLLLSEKIHEVHRRHPADSRARREAVAYGRAKDEIIAYLYQGCDLDSIKRVVTAEEGSYDYFIEDNRELYKDARSLQRDSFRASRGEMKQLRERHTKLHDRFLTLNSQWKRHVKRVELMIRMLKKALLDKYGTEDISKLDLNLLSVTPWQHWKYVLDD